MKKRIQVFPALSIDDAIIHMSVFVGASIGVGIFTAALASVLALSHATSGILVLAFSILFPSLMLPSLLVLWARNEVVDLHSEKGTVWAIGSIITFVAKYTVAAPFVLAFFPMLLIYWIIEREFSTFKGMRVAIADTFNISSVRLPAH